MTLEGEYQMKKEMRLDKEYLRIPLIRNGETQEVRFFADGTKILQVLIPVRTEAKGKETGVFAELCVKEWKGKTLVLETEGDAPLPEGILQADEKMEKQEDVYPVLHFTPVSGWINDPNGLCFYQGEYHLFFQHNLFDTEWNNMSWGHAVSRDLIHWTQKEEALLPDADGTMFSGSAIVNFRGESLCPKDALVLFYTCAGGSSTWSKGKRFIQKAAYSVDGEHFHKLPEVLVPHIAGENRDPKVGWMEEKQQYFMVLFLDGHEYVILCSKNLKEWKETQRLEIPESWECPDLIRFPKADGKEQWVFWTSDGYYLIGVFDGETFTAEQTVNRLYADGVPYAAQTFWGSDRVLQIPWLRLRWEDKPYQGAMGIPRELELVERNGEKVLAAHLLRELRDQEEICWKGIPGEKKELKTGDGHVLLLSVRNGENKNFTIQAGGCSLIWDAETGKLQVGEESFCLSSLSDLNVVLDRDILEVSCNQDTVCMYCRTPEIYEGQVVLSGEAEIQAGTVKETD